MFHRLLVALDGAELAPRAIEVSIALAQQLGAAIIGFIAEPPVPLPSPGARAQTPGQASDLTASVCELRTGEHAQRLLDGFGQRARCAGVAFEGHYLNTQDIDGAIVWAAQHHDCDMIVMVTHGRGAIGRFFLGSHTSKVVERSALPVLVMH